ncbi:MAG: hypothetical protein F9K27_12240 [Anaerolineae bacterium]|nr:MAG: hypothetical protein F9K27_12240 [Anaerolineae bacterium]
MAPAAPDAVPAPLQPSHELAAEQSAKTSFHLAPPAASHAAFFHCVARVRTVDEVFDPPPSNAHGGQGRPNGFPPDLRCGDPLLKARLCQQIQRPQAGLIPQVAQLLPCSIIQCPSIRRIAFGFRLKTTQSFPIKDMDRLPYRLSLSGFGAAPGVLHLSILWHILVSSLHANSIFAFYSTALL